MTLEELYKHPILNPENAPKDHCYGHRGGVECKTGWNQLLWDMAEKVNKIYVNAGVPVDLRILQIKEKFGELRIYYDFGEETRGPVMDFINAGFSVTLLGTNPLNDEIHKKVSSVIIETCDASKRTCEGCGSTDSSVGLRIGERIRIKTYCDMCDKKY